MAAKIVYYTTDPRIKSSLLSKVTGHEHKSYHVCDTDTSFHTLLTAELEKGNL